MDIKVLAPGDTGPPNKYARIQQLSPVVKTIIWFIIILIIMVILLYAIKPWFILRLDCNGQPITGDVDQARLWLASIITAIFIVLIIAIIVILVKKPS